MSDFTRGFLVGGGVIAALLVVGLIGRMVRL